MTLVTAAADSRRRYLRLAEVARAWGRNPATITRHLLRGVIDRQTGEVIRPEGVIKTPQCWLIPEGAYEEFLERVTAARLGTTGPSVGARRQGEQDRVNRELDREGF
jgi:hypothetical protein